MTKALIRGYAAGLSLLGFAAAWAATAESPWPGASGADSQVGPDDPRVAALDARETHLRRRAAEVRALIAQRTADAALPAPAQVVTLPPVARSTSS